LRSRVKSRGRGSKVEGRKSQILNFYHFKSFTNIKRGKTIVSLSKLKYFAYVWLYCMAVPYDYTVWLCRMAMPYGYAVWLCRMAMPYGYAVWLCRMAMPYGYAVWLCRMAMPYGYAVWLCRMAMPYGYAVWLYRMAMPYGYAVWLCRMAMYCIVESFACGTKSLMRGLMFESIHLLFCIGV
jgi:hypothetical protein